MIKVLSALENRVVDLDKKTSYRWLRQGRVGSRMLRCFAGYLFWLFYARRPYVGTRVVEIPWILNQLRNHTSGKERVLVVGDVLSQKLASSGHELEVVDMDAEANPGPRLKVQKVDIREANLSQSYFDTAISISTLEHIGLQGISFADGDKLAIEIISQSLKPNSLFFFSVPFGKPIIIEGFTRVYDQQRLTMILAGQFVIEEEAFFIWNGFRWQKTSLSIAEKASFLKGMPETYPGQNCGLALIRARKITET